MTPTALEVIVQDLRSFSHELLDAAGGATLVLQTSAARLDAGSGPQRQDALAVLNLVRSALQRIEVRERFDYQVLATSHTPRHGFRQVHPADWEKGPAGALPRRWQVPRLEPTPEESNQRWLLHAVRLAQSCLERRRDRVAIWLADAKQTRVVGSDQWALQSSLELQSLQDCYEREIADAERCAALIALSGVANLRPSSKPPYPFPLDPVWTQLRRHVVNLEQPSRFIASQIANALSPPITTADVPFLYQRWVGLQLLRALERHGWEVLGDPVGPLWLGGALSLKLNRLELTLVVEGRFSAREAGRLPIRCVRGESLTPDYTLFLKEAKRRSVWILDATLSPDLTLATSKQQKYLGGLRVTEPTLVAGVPTFPRPARVWVAAPIGDRLPHLGDPEGATGTVSADPSCAKNSGLHDWLSDLVV